MKRFIIAVIALLFCGFGLAGSVNAGEWTKIKDSSGIKLYERSVPGTDLMEYIGVTTIDARMEVIGEAIRDIPRYTEWLADCSSARIEKKYDRNTFVLYLVLNPFAIQRRDVVLKNETLYDYDNGNAKINFFATDEVKIPIEKKNVRVTTMKGLFQMEYLGRNKTKFIYKLKSDPSGDIPKRVAYAVMKYYPFDTLKNLKKIVTNNKYSNMAKGSEEEKQINARSVSEASVRKIFGDTVISVVKDKNTMAAIIAADGEGIKNIALSGGDYAAVQKTETDAYLKYIDKMVADKKVAASLKNNKKMRCILLASAPL